MRLGGDRPPQPDLGASLVEPGDVFLLCSDGFWGAIEPETLMGRLPTGPLGQHRAAEFVALAREEKDYATENFLQWFVNEQVEEEASVDAVVQKLKMASSAPGALFFIDRMLGER